MTRLLTSAKSLRRWIGIGPLHRSDNLKIPSPEKARWARRLWEDLKFADIPLIGGDDDVA